MISEIKLKFLNELLQEITEDHERVADLLEKICPGNFEECDPELNSGMEAKDCPYFKLCNIMGSYSLLDPEEQEKADEFLERFYVGLRQRRTKDNSMYA